MFTQFKRLSFAAACTLAIMIGAVTSANAIPLPAPDGSGNAGGDTAGHVVHQVIVTTVPWHLIVPIIVAASVLLAVAFAATFTAIHTRHVAHPHQA